MLFAVLTPEQLALERAADALLCALPPDPERPAYTETQLARRSRRWVSLEALGDLAEAAPEPLREELRFLASVSRIRRLPRLCLKLWIDGWGQREIAGRLGVSQQRVSQHLRQALSVCYDAAPLSFRRFSHHTIYRRPSHARPDMILRGCRRCGEAFALGLGCAGYCSPRCREIALHKQKKTEK